MVAGGLWRCLRRGLLEDESLTGGDIGCGGGQRGQATQCGRVVTEEGASLHRRRRHSCEHSGVVVWQMCLTLVVLVLGAPPPDKAGNSLLELAALGAEVVIQTHSNIDLKSHY